MSCVQAVKQDLLVAYPVIVVSGDGRSCYESHSLFTLDNGARLDYSFPHWYWTEIY